MESRHRASPPSMQGGGVAYRVVAALLVLAGAAYLLWPGHGVTGRARGMASDSDAARAEGRPAMNATNSVDADGTGATPRTLPRGVPTRDLSEVVSLAPGQPAPGMGEVIERLHREGIRDGLGAFNPPGTSPPLVGIAVPEDYPLPEGYVRHHQTTDDGQDIEAILMFSPDYQFFDAAGQPIQVPANRVVPPQWAPPGLPIRQVRIPPPLAAGEGGAS